VQDGEIGAGAGEVGHLRSVRRAVEG
jgi:hypothetical protein